MWKRAIGLAVFAALTLEMPCSAKAREEGVRRLLYVTSRDGAGGHGGKGIYISYHQQLCFLSRKPSDQRERANTLRAAARIWLAALPPYVYDIDNGHQLVKFRSLPSLTINAKDDGYRGIWYMNQPSGDEYVYKYSGGLGTYCAKHKPFAVYAPEVEKTFFCYGGTTKDSNRRLVHMVSYYDHQTQMVPRPTVLLDKKTNDAHDNPVISLDGRGHIWIFSTSHGRSRPSYIHRSKLPYSIDEFERVAAVRRDGQREIPITNFSYMQVWHEPRHGFLGFFTRYSDPAKRTTFFLQSADGVTWKRWQRLAAIDEGHYQISAVGKRAAGTAFNYHPNGKGLNWRTNLYYLETPDGGQSWKSADGQPLELPLTEAASPALVYDYQRESLNVYLKDIRYDQQENPIILFLTSKGYQSGPENSPRTWTTARWTGEEWDIRPAFTSDNNYDMGSLFIEHDGTWRIIAPTEVGPQPFNPGGEVAMWQSDDRGITWKKVKQLTRNSGLNHTYVRRPVNAHPDFYGLWADGHGRQPSPSSLYFCDKAGNVRRLPRVMQAAREVPPLENAASQSFNRILVDFPVHE